jgi:hypothetical protein
MAAYLETQRHHLKSHAAEAEGAASPAPAPSADVKVPVDSGDMAGAGRTEDVERTLNGRGADGEWTGSGPGADGSELGRQGASAVGAAGAPQTTGFSGEGCADFCVSFPQGVGTAEASGAASADFVRGREEGPMPVGMDAVEQWHGPHHPLMQQATQTEAEDMAGIAANASAAELAAAAAQSVKVLMQAVALQPGDGDLWWRCGLLLERDLLDLTAAEEKYRAGSRVPTAPPPLQQLPGAEMRCA